MINTYHTAHPFIIVPKIWAQIWHSATLSIGENFSWLVVPHIHVFDLGQLVCQATCSVYTLRQVQVKCQVRCDVGSVKCQVRCDLGSVRCQVRSLVRWRAAQIWYSRASINRYHKSFEFNVSAVCVNEKSISALKRATSGTRNVPNLETYRT